MVRKRALSILATLTVAVAVTPLATAQASAPQPKLPKLVTLKDVRHHQLNLQKIADANGGNRLAGLPGNQITIKYIADQLKRAGYTPTVQTFDINYWEELSDPVFAETAPTPKTFTPTTDFATLQYSGAGDVTAAATAVDLASAGLGSGCEASDFTGFPAGNIALIQRGGCFFSEKADNAVAAGASAVVIYQRPDVQGPVGGTLTNPYSIPVVGPTNAIGVSLAQQAQNGGVTLHIKTDTRNQVKQAANVIADTERGRADNVVVVGAHNDSVEAGPGINDDGSGTPTLLTMAQQINKLGSKIHNKVRFAFWGAEEEGLIGSQYYVDHLAPADQAKIALMLDFDMLGSPNYVNFVYDGDNSSGNNNVPGPAGSGAIEKTFNDYFAGRGLPTDPTAFDGRSDYNAFILVGIPAGGIFTGAEGIKTAEQAQRYGGTAGQPYDPCYHQACDRYDNVDLTGFDHMIDATAFATEMFAYSTLTVNGNELAKNRATTKAKATRPDRLGHFWAR
ncbi:M28 family peptidase [Actinomadura scrupuli]|uniref:M28 family peptidase n=1 Tax=Actinomadura scrupuli TaxID=559629 RepID=UPI003D98EA30